MSDSSEKKNEEAATKRDDDASNAGEEEEEDNHKHHSEETDVLSSAATSVPTNEPPTTTEEEGNLRYAGYLGRVARAIPKATPKLLKESKLLSRVMRTEGKYLPKILKTEGKLLPKLLRTEGKLLPKILRSEGKLLPKLLRGEGKLFSRIIKSKPIKNLAHAADVGEAVKPVASHTLVHIADFLTWAFIVGDVSYEAHRLYTQPDYEIRGLELAAGVSQRAAFQVSASIVVPGFLVKHTVIQSRKLFARMGRGVNVGPTLCGLGLVPLLPFYVDPPLEFAFETAGHWVRQRIRRWSGKPPLPPLDHHHHAHSH